MDLFKEHGLRISRKNGLLLGVLLIAYFLLMKVIGLGHNYYLRAFNAVLVLLMMQQGVKAYRQNLESEKYGTFFELFKLTMRTAFIGISIFSVFLAFYLDLLNPAFMAEIKTMESTSPYLSPVSVVGIVFIEGFGSAFVLSYLLIQAVKKRTVELKPESIK